MPTKHKDPIRHLIQAVLADVTLTRLRLLLVLNVLAVLVFWFFAVTTISQHEHTATTVAYSAAPSVFAAHEIGNGIEQMDTFLANELLYPSGHEQKPEMARRFEDARASVCRQIVAAAKNITYGKSEQIPIENLLLASGLYQMQAQQARDLQNDGKVASAIDAYLETVKTLEGKLLPNAWALDRANSEQLESIYGEEKSKSALSCGLVLVIGMVLVALLTITQIYLAKRFRRRFNLPLLLSTICAVIFVQYLYSSLRESTQHLKVAKEDSYDSLVAVLETRASAYHANAVQSRWLLDRIHCDKHDRDFSADITKIAAFEDGYDFSKTIEDAQKQFSAGKKLSLRGFKGSLADEFRNLTFEGEAQSALDALRALSSYCDADARMRQLEKSGKHAEALEVGLGYNPNHSKFPFSQFDEALKRMLELNQHHFEQGVRRAFDELRLLALFTGIICLLLLNCIYIGIRPRMVEYLS
jgi:hypothetical protein